MQFAMSFVMPDDRIVIMEDDDWYAKNYLEAMEKMFSEGYDLVGQGGTYYYHYPTARVCDMTNRYHCSFFQTGFRAHIMHGLQWPENHMLDLALWKTDCKKKILPQLPPLAIGLKGLPGRAGQSCGHDSNYKRYKPDKDREWLRGWIGEDIKNYERMLECS